MRSVVLSTRFMLFYCPECLVTIQEIPKLTQQINELRKDVDQLKKSVESKPSYADVLKDVEKETSSIKGEIETMKVKMDVRPDAMGTVPGVETSSNVASAIIEMREREKRACNLLVFGLPESKEENREGRKADEKQRVTDIIKQLDKNSSTEQIKMHRLGRYGEDKVRPVKVIFPSKEEALKVLRAKHDIQRQNIYIKYDQTPSERAFLRDLTVELQRRTQNGEANLGIKYIDGIPRIIRKRAAKPAAKN